MEENKGRNAAKDLACGLLLAAFGVFIVIDALNMKVYNTFVDAPGFFPTIIGAVIAVLGAVLAFIGYRLGGLGQLREVMNGAALKGLVTSEGAVRVAVLTLIMAAYIFGLLGRVHFIVANSIYLTVTFLYLRATKRWWISVIIAVATSAVVYYAFKLGFGISMP